MGRARAEDVGAERSYITGLSLFESERDIDVAAARAEFEDDEYVLDLSASSDGRFARVTFTVTTTDLGRH